jgi:LPXTG-site transpeptidase (sortase) family protein
VVLPTLDVSASLVELDLDAQGVMTTPEEGARAGWFTPAPPPGVIGVSVIAGHVTWDDAPAVFFRLGELRPGDRVEVERRDGVTAVFEVRRIGEFPKDEFPTEAVYRQVNHADLRLITCGGEFDEASGHYLSNVIVWARMVSHHRT